MEVLPLSPSQLNRERGMVGDAIQGLGRDDLDAEPWVMGWGGEDPEERKGREGHESQEVGGIWPSADGAWIVAGRYVDGRGQARE